MDVRELQVPDACFDVAIDKGTLDAFLHGSLWDPPDDVRSNVGKYVDEVTNAPIFIAPVLLWQETCVIANFLTGCAGAETRRTMALYHL